MAAVTLLTPEEQAWIDAARAEGGPWDAAALLENISKNFSKAATGASDVLDAAVIRIADAMLAEPVFVDGDVVLGRRALLERWPLEDLERAPEDLFVQQEVGVFAGEAPGEFEYRRRGAGDAAGFRTALDMVRGTAAGEPLGVFPVRVFVAGADWEDFKMLHRFARAATKFVPALTGGGAMRALCGLLQAAAGDPPAAIEYHAAPADGAPPP